MAGISDWHDAFGSLAHLAQLIAELTANGTALVCTSQGIDTSDSNPAGRLQLGVLMAVAELEREIIRERVNAGLAAARAAKLGRPAKLAGHRDAVAVLIAQGKGSERSLVSFGCLWRRRTK
ncbi:MAG: recombinase family protein [Verrucomicrobiota bacterium]